MNFYIGETVICSATVKNKAGKLKEVATSMEIVINMLNPRRTRILAPTAMVGGGTGIYHYDFASAGKDKGQYEARCTATDSGRITIGRNVFVLE
ncbi:hypothetical protein LCGC14_1260080 [marine sediment metagenome]|uniref:Uncharacterized protein n=1 Tax=marine sediment metagenome TaxID=412755 RepID=A0A0F9NHN4_9ZZZZ